MNTAALCLRQFQFEFRSYFRNRSGLIFTLALPVMFLLVFGLGKNSTVQFHGRAMPIMQFLVPGIVAYGVIGATYTSLAIRLTTLRESGVLKRAAGTPLPRWIYIFGQVLNAVVLATVITAITLILARIMYGIHTYAHTAPALVITVAVGAATFCAIGIAMSSSIPNADAAPGIVQFTILPVMFISDIWFSIDKGPHWVVHIADALPVKPFANALQVALDPNTSGAGFSFHYLRVVAIWGVVCGIIAVRKFRWESSKGSSEQPSHTLRPRVSKVS